MYLRHAIRKKDGKVGKVHRYWCLVRKVRVGRRVIQQTVAHLGELDECGRVERRVGATADRRTRAALLSDDGSRDEAVPVHLKGIRLENFHVRHRAVYREQHGRLVLVKGGRGSQLLIKAVKINVVGADRTGKPLKVLSPEMQRFFGRFGGKLSFQRSPTRWVDEDHVEKAARFVRGLE